LWSTQTTEWIARLKRACSVEDYVRLRHLAAGAKAYIERDAEVATQMAVLATRIETALEEQLRRCAATPSLSWFPAALRAVRPTPCEFVACIRPCKGRRCPALQETRDTPH